MKNIKYIVNIAPNIYMHTTTLLMSHSSKTFVRISYANSVDSDRSAHLQKSQILLEKKNQRSRNA